MHQVTNCPQVQSLESCVPDWNTRSGTRQEGFFNKSVEKLVEKGTVASVKSPRHNGFLHFAPMLGKLFDRSRAVERNLCDGPKDSGVGGVSSRRKSVRTWKNIRWRLS